jgi:hypothetical protein
MSSAKWYQPLKKMQEDTGYKDLKIKFFYGRRVDNGKTLSNFKGLDYVRDILGWLKTDKNNIESLESLKLQYEVEGSDEEKYLDFIRNKVTSFLVFTRGTNGKVPRKDMKQKINEEFNLYLSSGKPTPEIKD